MNQIICGDSIIELKKMPENSVDSIVTDPPYGLGFMNKEWDSPAEHRRLVEREQHRSEQRFLEGKSPTIAPFSKSVRPGLAIKGAKEGKWFQGWFNLVSKEMLRVLKPGGYLLSFGGTRTYHRMACAIEDAGFEIRDCIFWTYASGFPKSLNVFKQLQKNCTCGNMEAYERAQQNTKYNMRLVPETDLSQTINSEEKQGKVLQSGLSEQSSYKTMSGEEPQKSGKGKEERILEGGNNTKKTEGKLQGGDLSKVSAKISDDGEERRIYNATQISNGSTLKQDIKKNGSGASQGPQPEQQPNKEPCDFCKQWGTQATRTYGIGTALKPAVEPITVARKPLSEKSVAENVLKWGTGGINIDECRVEVDMAQEGSNAKRMDKTYRGTSAIWNNADAPTTFDGYSKGRFPANLIHDGSDEVVSLFPNSQGGYFPQKRGSSAFFGLGDAENRSKFAGKMGDSGSASRFFYCAKASKSERNMGCEELEEKDGGCFDGNNDMNNNRKIGANPSQKVQPSKNNHPTVKPIALMEYLIKLVTPPKGIVLDPFLGSGTTAVAAKQLGFNYIGIEKEPEYIKIAEARIKAVPASLNL